jgi:hypothetical protein
LKVLRERSVASRRAVASSAALAIAFQAVTDLPYVDVDCFGRTDPVVVPARTLLSQLL